MNRLHVLFLVILLCVVNSFAQSSQETPSTTNLMVDKSKAPLVMNFKIPLIGVSDARLQFSNFSSRLLVIYYFNPKSPYSQQYYPAVQKLINDFSPKGLTGLAVSDGDVTKNDIQKFIQKNMSSLPYFLDAAKTFRTLYGNGYSPIIYLVYENGNIVRYTDLSIDVIKQLNADLQKYILKK